MDITFGTIPMIVMTFQGYCLVRNFATEYNSFNKKLQGVLRDITITASIFKNAVNTLLAEVIEENTREVMLEDLGSKHWWQNDLNNQLEGILGNLFEAVRDSISRNQETLKEIKDVLLLLSGNTVCPAEKKFPFGRLTKSVAVIATSVIKSDPFQLQFKNIQIQSTRKKLLSLVKDHRGELERLRDELRLHNNDFLAILRLAPYRKSNSRTNRPTRIHQVSPSSQDTGSSACDMARACLDSKAMQSASQRLYRMVSQTLLCECHLIHLCLDKQAKATPVSKDLKGKSKQQSQLSEPSLNFTFQLTAKPNGGSKERFSSMQQPAIHLVFTGLDFKDTDPIPDDNASKPMVCEELLASNEGHERHLRDSLGSNCGFLLRRVCPRFAAKSSGCISPLSLDDLVASRPTELRSFDRFLVAANLAYSLVHFYSSPWVRDWSLQTIHYFEKQESTSTLGLWTPHLSLKCDNHDIRQFGVKNREIHSLGLILLQLGGKKRLEILQGEEEELVLEKALEDLCREMGPKYMTFVRNCLSSWSERSMDLMKNDNLNAFLSHVSVLEEQAQFFNSG